MSECEDENWRRDKFLCGFCWASVDWHFLKMATVRREAHTTRFGLSAVSVAFQRFSPQPRFMTSPSHYCIEAHLFLTDWALNGLLTRIAARFYHGRFYNHSCTAFVDTADNNRQWLLPAIIGIDLLISWFGRRATRRHSTRQTLTNMISCAVSFTPRESRNCLLGKISHRCRESIYIYALYPSDIRSFNVSCRNQHARMNTIEQNLKL